jgi:hypothetical protein
MVKHVTSLTNVTKESLEMEMVGLSKGKGLIYSFNFEEKVDFISK